MSFALKAGTGQWHFNSFIHSFYLNQTNGPYILEKYKQKKIKTTNGNRSKRKSKLIQKCMRTYAPHKLDNYIIVATPYNIKRMFIISLTATLLWLLHIT